MRYGVFLLPLARLVLGGNPADESLLWGTYRSNLYLGIRPRIPHSLSFGLMWATVEDGVITHLRHTCEQSDGMEGYGWSTYDGRTGGIQTISDPINHVDIATEFVKTSDPVSGPDGNWGLRVKGVMRDSIRDPRNLTAILYMALGEEPISHSSTMSCTIDSASAVDGSIECSGFSSGLGPFHVLMPSPRSSNKHQTLIHGIDVPQENLWEAKKYFAQHFGQPTSLESGKSLEHHNLYFIQRVFSSNFQLDVLFSSNSSNVRMSSDSLTSALDHSISTFDSRFNSVFQPLQPFLGDHYLRFGKAILSNLLGGISYFYGDSKVDNRSYSETDVEFWKFTSSARSRESPRFTTPMELFTSVPSRSFFPRGFLWDEGFHLLVVIDWDLDFAMEIVQSWLALMDDDGWIAREQILGPEARSQVPKEFQTQYPNYANPPTLFMVIEELLDKLSGRTPYHGARSKYLKDRSAGRALLETIHTKLSRQYIWFRNTQRANMTYIHQENSSLLEGYRWRGRTPRHTLTSGLDDYPRAMPPHPGELHVDALSWVGSMADILSKMAADLDKIDLKREINSQKSAVQRSLEENHWSITHQTFCDMTIRENVSVHVCHKGYVSLMPFLVGLLAHNDPRLESILGLIRDEGKLWSPHGIRSLSKKDEFYGKDENYWRGPVWININYLAIRRLMELAQKPGPFQAKARNMYTELRQNVVLTVYKSFQDTGFVWEQYNPDTGAGQRTQHFTGWTSLVVKIMTFPDLVQDNQRDNKTPQENHILPSYSPRASAIGSIPHLLLIGMVGVAVTIIFFPRQLLRWRRLSQFGFFHKQSR